jgi:alpha-ketoglutarate-dependent taurine dioxygenase
LIVWDNLALQHARPEMPEVEARTLRRVTLATAGVADQVEAFGYGS